MEQAFKSERVLIGQGKMAKVYLWQGYAYKCYRKGFRQEWVQGEIDIQNSICQTDLPVVRYYPSEFPLSIKMDYVKGVSLADRMRHEKYKQGLEDLVALFPSIHEHTGLALPELKPALLGALGRVDIDPADRALGERFVEEIPPGGALCHLDYHFLNLLYAEGHYTIIDWVTAKMGNPIYDFARTYVIAYEFAFRLAGKYLGMVQERYGFDETELQKAIYVMAAHRLSEFESAKSRELMEKCKAQL